MPLTQKLKNFKKEVHYWILIQQNCHQQNDLGDKFKIIIDYYYY